jgi:hypothetical protein
MTSSKTDDVDEASSARPVQLELALPRHEQGEINELLKAFDRGEINPDQVVSKLMVLYQTGIGGAARALAELDQGAAQRLGERLRQRIESFLSEFDLAGAAAKPPASKAPMSKRLKGKSDAVLLRELALFESLASTDQEITWATLVELVRSREPEISGPTITANLDRLTKEALIARDRKGRYRSTPRSKEYLTAIRSEIEARGPPSSS